MYRIFAAMPALSELKRAPDQWRKIMQGRFFHSKTHVVSHNFYLLSIVILVFPLLGYTSTSVQGLFSECLGYFNAREYDKVIAIGTKALRYTANDREMTLKINQLIAQSYLHKGWDASHKRDYKQAIQLYDKALDYNPTLSDARERKAAAYNDLANDYYLSRDYVRAIVFYDAALNTGSQFRDRILRNRGMAREALAKRYQYSEIERLIAEAVANAIVQGLIRAVLR